MKNLGFYFAVFNRQTSHSYRQLEPSWPGASGIEIEHAVFPLLLGHVAVPVDNRGEFRGLRLEVEFLNAVQHVDGYFADLKNIRSWDFLGPCPVINVAAHHRERRDRGKPVEDLRIANVTGVDDVVGALQSGNRLRAEQAMRVGDDADDHSLILTGSTVGQFLGPLGGLYHGFNQRHPQFALFEFQNAVDGASGRSGHRVFELRRMLAGFEYDCGRA